MYTLSNEFIFRIISIVYLTAYYENVSVPGIFTVSLLIISTKFNLAD
jgi:hypothetical protein